MTAKTNVPTSCAQLAARMVVEGCLPIIQGDVQGDVGIVPVPLNDEERSRLGISRTAGTLFYPVGDDGVFLDLGQAQLALWFSGRDVVNATKTLHDALMKAFPKAKQLDDVPHTADARMRARVYRVELKHDRLAVVRTSFFAAKDGGHTFRAQVVAQQRKS